MARIYRPSQKGQVPFDPVSMALSVCLRIEKRLSWNATSTMLKSEEGAPWRRLFGFEECYQPMVSTCDLQGPTTLTGGGLTDRDGSAASPPGRPCRARDRGLEGCACDGPECAQQCRRASRLDKEARFIHYEGHNHKHDQQAAETRGKGIDLFGYRSVADRVLDDRFAVAWTVRSQLYPANSDERTVFKLNLAQVKQRFKELLIGEVLADSGLGYGECLNAVWQSRALRMIDIREDPSDKDFEACLRRGYDGKGHPQCPHGYQMSPNGYDYQRRRAKYVCNQICRRVGLREDQPVQPPSGCPYLAPSRPLGSVQNLGRVFRDGSVRLAREIPYGSDEWKARYGRRNMSESRHGQLERMGLKRMRSYGLERNQKEVQLADFLINLHTLGRLVRQATALARN